MYLPFTDTDTHLQAEIGSVPVVSYSSSEEEDFYDAEEDQKSPKPSPE